MTLAAAAAPSQAARLLSAAAAAGPSNPTPGRGRLIQGHIPVQPGLLHFVRWREHMQEGQPLALPGPGAIYVSQTLNFKGPVKIGDEVATHVELVELMAGKRRAAFDCRCLVAGKPVVEGTAVLMVPSRPK